MASNFQQALDRERNPGLDDIKALSKELADIARMVEAAKADQVKVGTCGFFLQFLFLFLNFGFYFGIWIWVGVGLDGT